MEVNASVSGYLQSEVNIFNLLFACGSSVGRCFAVRVCVCVGGGGGGRGHDACTLMVGLP